MYQRKDHYYKKAKQEGRVSRASYKLEQIQSKFKVIKKGDFVLDLGCAPGSWMEVAGGIVGEKGRVFGIDILPIKIQLKPNMRFEQWDICDESAHPLKKGGEGGFKYDVILSDMAPNTSGVAFRDCYLSYELCMMALETAKKTLKPGGHFVAKIFQGEELADFKKELTKCFNKVGTYIPPATRTESKELYLIALQFKKDGI